MRYISDKIKPSKLLAATTTKLLLMIRTMRSCLYDALESVLVITADDV